MHYKEFEKLKQNIEDLQFHIVFEILEELLGTIEAEYKGLENYFKIQPIGYSEDNLRKRLLNQIRSDKILIIEGIKDKITNNNTSENKEVDFYSLLCRFNFTDQFKYFRNIVKYCADDKFVLPFFVRGNNEFGKKWLYNRLIYYSSDKLKTQEEPIEIDLGSHSFSMPSLLEEIAEKLNFKEQFERVNDVVRKKSLIADGIVYKLMSSSVIFVIKNPKSIIVNNTSQHSICDLLNDIQIRAESRSSFENKILGKCLFLFIEEENDSYTQIDHFVDSSNTSESIVNMEKKVKIIDLCDLKLTTEKCVGNWLKITKSGKITKGIEVLNSKEFQYSCKGLNPLTVIQSICDITGVNYEKIKETCLKK